MSDSSDMDLLRNYAQENSEAAFAELVRRHLGLVFSAALRHVGIAAQAEEIAQAVFIILARKAGSLRSDLVLEAWLFETTRLASISFLRAERRRQFREQEAYMESTLGQSSPDDSLWRQIVPTLDEALTRLNGRDREAIVMRFFKEKNLREVAARLRISEAAAQKRVDRALEKLQRYFNRRGISSTTAILAGTISANCIQAAPVALARTVIAVAIGKGAIATVSTLTLVKGTLGVMTWMKTKMAILIGAALVLAAGAETLREAGHDTDVLARQPPEVKIVRSKTRDNAHVYGSEGRMAGAGVSAATMVSVAYGFPTTARTVVATDLPSGAYDFIASLTNNRNEESLRREVQKIFGVVARTETRETNVMLLKVKTADVLPLRPSTAAPADEYETWNTNHYESKRKQIGHFACVLEQYSNIPIINQADFTNLFDLNVSWQGDDLVNRNWSKINRALAPLGLELTPSRQAIEMLVVEKAR